MEEVVIAGAARTAMGGFQGVFAGVDAAMLGGAKIYDEPPREASLPYVTLGEAVVSDRSTATEGGEANEVAFVDLSFLGGSPI